MNELYTTLSLALMLSWVLFALARVFLPARRAVVLGVAVGLGLTVIARGTLPVQVLVSLFEPVALGLSFLILRSFARPFFEVRNIPVWEQTLVLLLLLGYLFTSGGAMLFDPYRFGFDPLWSGAIAVGLSIYAGLRGYIGFALMPVVAQVVWVVGLSSSNYFDHLFSALMVPVLMVSIIRTIGIGIRE